MSIGSVLNQSANLTDYVTKDEMQQEINSQVGYTKELIYTANVTDIEEHQVFLSNTTIQQIASCDGLYIELLNLTVNPDYKSSWVYGPGGYSFVTSQQGMNVNKVAYYLPKLSIDYDESSSIGTYLNGAIFGIVTPKTDSIEDRYTPVEISILLNYYNSVLTPKFNYQIRVDSGGTISCTFNLYLATISNLLPKFIFTL